MARDYLPLKPGLLPRPRVEALLKQAVAGQFTAVVAGPGYGKTQAVASFASKSRRRLIWLGLTPRENDPHRFWAAMLDAMQHEFAPLAAGLPQPDLLHTLKGYSTFVAAFSKELYTGRPATLVLDNYNLTNSAETRGIVRSFISLGLENLHIIVISSARRDLYVAQERYGQEHTIITSEEMRFTKAEIQALYRLYGKPFTAAGLQQLREETEGWPLAVYLACRHGQPEKQTPPYAPYIEELFEIGYFSGYAMPYRQLLAQLSLLPSFSLEMVKILAGPVFEPAEKNLLSNIFLTQDPRTHLFTFHKLYREYLCGKQYILSKRARQHTFKTAGEWYNNNHFHPEAVEAFFHAGCYREMVDVILNVPVARQTAGWSTHMLHYLNQLPVAFAAGNVKVDLCKAFMHLNVLQVSAAFELFGSIRMRLEGQDGEEEQWLLGETYAVLADISAMQNTDHFVEYIQKAASYLPQGSALRSAKLMLVGNNEVFYLPHPGPGQAAHMLHRVFAAAPAKEKVFGPHGAGYEWLFAAEHAFLTGDYTHAQQHCLKARCQATANQQHDIAINAGYILARIHALQGNYHQVHKHWAEILEYIDGHQWGEKNDLRGYFEGWYYLLMEDFGQVPRWVTEFDYAHYSMMLNDNGRGIQLYVWYLMIKQKYHEALAYIAQQENIARKKGLWVLLLHSYLVKSGCHLYLGESDAALEAFWQAYQMAYHNNILTPFISHGLVGKELCALAGRTHRYNFDTGWLATVAEKAEQTAQNYRQLQTAHKAENPLPHPAQALTPREKQVLQHLVAGLKRGEIADILGISVSGVKSHIGNIYSKLGAVNRADAVRRAMLTGEVPLPEEDVNA